MRPLVEPQAGSELERLITALLNATGAVRRVIDTTGDGSAIDGIELIGIVAEHLRRVLAPLAEHSGDDELAVVTRILAETTFLVAADLRLDGLFGDA